MVRRPLIASGFRPSCRVPGELHPTSHPDRQAGASITFVVNLATMRQNFEAECPPYRWTSTGASYESTSTRSPCGQDLTAASRRFASRKVGQTGPYCSACNAQSVVIRVPAVWTEMSDADQTNPTRLSSTGTCGGTLPLDKFLDCLESVPPAISRNQMVIALLLQVRLETSATSSLQGRLHHAMRPLLSSMTPFALYLWSI